MSDTQDIQVILNAKGATGEGTDVCVEGYRHCVLEVATDGDGDANLTIKVQGSISQDCPDFASAQSKTNHWDYIEVIDLQNGNDIDGDTGISVAGADDYRLLEVNINVLRWLNVSVTARSEGEITAKCKLFNS